MLASTEEGEAEEELVWAVEVGKRRSSSPRHGAPARPKRRPAASASAMRRRCSKTVRGAEGAVFVLRGCTGGARTGKLASPSPSPSDDDALEAAEEDRPLSRSKRDIENK